MRDHFRNAVGGVALAALLTTGVLIAGVWAEQDAGLSRYERVR